MSAFIITGLLGTLVAFGAPAGEGMPPGEGGFLGPGLCRRLECTAVQEQQMTEIVAAHRAEVATDRAELQRLRAEMAAELAGAELDLEKLRRLQTQRSVVQAKMAQARLQSMIEVHGMLTPAQRQTWAEDMATGAGRGSGRRGGPRGEGG